ncbi:hypothetical protein QOZ80_8AG0619320 [Eleusine coracana subsp. coracana]|nr:hypothetical protein QOZ80_8AG0619320 [Eleusine coracana subsp. coracana]
MADLLLLVLDDVVEEQKMDAATRSYFAEGAGAPSWPAAEWTRSTLRDGNHIKAELRGKHGIPREYIIHMAGSKTAACAAFPAGKSIISVYADARDAGLRVPVAGFQAALLRHYGLAPSQLTPSAWRYVSAFELLCRDAGVEPVPSLFRCFFSLCTRRGDDAGWHYFQTRRHAPRRLFTGSTGGNSDWRTRFFLLQAPTGSPWQCPVKWGRPSRKAVEVPQLTAAGRADMNKLMLEVATWNAGGIDFGLFLSGRRRLSLSPAPGQLQAVVVKREPIEVTMIEQQEKEVARKRGRSPESPAAAATPAPDSTRVGFVEPASSASRSLMFQFLQTFDAEMNGNEQKIRALDGEVARHKEELQAARAEVGRLGEELRAEKELNAAMLAEALRAERDAHATRLGEEQERGANELRVMKAEASLLKKDVEKLHAELQSIDAALVAKLEASNADVDRLKAELESIHAIRAAELEASKAEASRLEEKLMRAWADHKAHVRAIRVEHERELASLKHRSVVAMNERYVMGMKRMRSLAHATYPDVVDPAELNHQVLLLLPDSDDPDDKLDLVGSPPQPPVVEDQ